MRSLSRHAHIQLCSNDHPQHLRSNSSTRTTECYPTPQQNESTASTNARYGPATTIQSKAAAAAKKFSNQQTLRYSAHHPVQGSKKCSGFLLMQTFNKDSQIMARASRHRLQPTAHLQPILTIICLSLPAYRTTTTSMWRYNYNQLMKWLLVLHAPSDARVGGVKHNKMDQQGINGAGFQSPALGHLASRLCSS